MIRARHISGTVVIATAAFLYACADPTSGPTRLDSSAHANAVTAFDALTPEQLTSGTEAMGVNENGDAVGYGPGAVSCTSDALPKLWRANGTLVVLPLGTHCGGVAYTIKNSGAIVGQVYGPAGSALWLPNAAGGYTIQELDFVAGHLVRVLGGLNETGEIVGWYNNAEMYWRTASTPWTLMAVPAGASQCQVRRGINKSGAIVAACSISGGYMTGYYWPNHSATPVALPRLSATGLLFPTQINDAGVIVGFQYFPEKAVRWTPNALGGYSVEYLPDAGDGGAAYGVARDGTVSGSVLDPDGFGIPVLWPASGGYQILPVLGDVLSAEADDVATSPLGASVAAGYQDTQALRWK